MELDVEKDFCQIKLQYNYNVLITYCIKEVDCGSQMKSCGQSHLEEVMKLKNHLFSTGSCFLISSSAAALLLIIFSFSLASTACTCFYKKNVSAGARLLACLSKEKLMSRVRSYDPPAELHEGTEGKAANANTRGGKHTMIYHTTLWINKI